jgi:hypothetical protein
VAESIEVGFHAWDARPLNRTGTISSSSFSAVTLELVPCNVAAAAAGIGNGSCLAGHGIVVEGRRGVGVAATAEVRRDDAEAGVDETATEADDKAENAASDASDIVSNFGKGASNEAKVTAENTKEVGGEAADAAKDTGAKRLGSTESDITKKIDSDVFSTKEFLDTNKSHEDAAHKGDVKNFEGLEFEVSTNTSESDVTKKINSDVLRTDEFPAIGDHVKSADEEVGDVLRDMLENAFGATKEKVNEAGENLEEKTEAARKEASARAHAAKARGEYTVDSEWAGEATNDAV